MCGRFDRHSELDVFATLVEGLVLDGAPALPASYNVTPSQDALAIALDDERRPRVRILNWGLVPAWSAKAELRRPINARLETVAEKPMFRSGFARHRCLIPCDGYYEWTVLEHGKQPFYFYREGAPILLAGIYEHNTRLGKLPIDSFAILTREAAEGVAKVHHRMPVIIDGDAIDAWLDPDTPVEAAHDLAQNESLSALSFYPVSTFVNSPANNSPQCIEPHRGTDGGS
jgi:putative SOS response-associated peptidase YedK